MRWREKERRVVEKPIQLVEIIEKGKVIREGQEEREEVKELHIGNKLS